MLTLWHNIKGYFMAVTAFIACPCHLPLTLPLLLSLTAGTALGAWLSQNVTLVFVLSTATFLGGLALALKWLGTSDGRGAAPPTRRRDRRVSIAPPQPSACSGCQPGQTSEESADEPLFLR
jgi:hypothetical protein